MSSTNQTEQVCQLYLWKREISPQIWRYLCEERHEIAGVPFAGS